MPTLKVKPVGEGVLDRLLKIPKGLSMSARAGYVPTKVVVKETFTIILCDVEPASVARKPNQNLAWWAVYLRARRINPSATPEKLADQIGYRIPNP